MRDYRIAQLSADSLPRVFVKVGSLHGAKWPSNLYTQTLGTFLNGFATANSRSSFHLAAWLVNEPDTYWSLTDTPALALLGRAGSPSETVVIDLRPLRDLWYGGQLRAMSADMVKAIFGFDAALLIGSGSRGSYQRLRGSGSPASP